MNEVVVRRRGPIARFFLGLWNAVNFTRRLIMNIVFFAVLLFIIGLLMREEQPTTLAANSVLLLEPKGRLVEQDDRDPITRLLSTADSRNEQNRVVQLRDLIGVIDAATKDKSVKHILMDVDSFNPSGFASLHEVMAALQRFRASGKKITAFSQGMSQGQYLMAAQADEIFLDPQGYGVMLEGLASYRPYMREGLQDKLGVDFRLFKVGEYKSAAEPYVRDNASPESKVADLFWMNDLWTRYIDDIAKARKLSPDTVRASIDNMASGVAAAQGDLAAYAVQQKWVDGLKTREEVEAYLAKKGFGDDASDDGLRSIGMNEYIASNRLKVPSLSTSSIGVVVAEGEIVPGRQDPGSIGGESTAELLRSAREDDAIKAVVLRVNSPGGEVFASEQIRREVEALKAAGKPVVVSMGDVAASGGYWISMNADRIYADPSTITGSIGIFGLVPNVTRALGKIGVHTDGVGTSPLAGATDPTRPLDEGLATLIQSVIEKGYRDFTGKVAAARGKPVEAIDAVARGRVWSGAQAKERGLVDAFGGLSDAVNDAATRAKLGKAGTYNVRYIENTAAPFGGLFGSRLESRIAVSMLKHSSTLQGFAAGFVPDAQKQLQAVQAQLIRRDASPVKAMAHCFCVF